MTRAAALAALLPLLLLAACPAPRPLVRPVRALPIPLEAAPAGHDEPLLAGVVHVVRPGETIWRIARAYGIDPADLMETNGIDDPRAVPAGAELFVPGAAVLVEVPQAPAPVPEPPPGVRVIPGPAGPLPSPSASSGSAPVAPLRPANPPPPGDSSSAPPSPSSAPPSPSPSPSALAPSAKGGAPLSWPLRGVLYGRFGVREGRRHDGIDIAAPEGTAVAAAADGTVIFAGEQAGYGFLAILRHEGGLVTVYAHNSSLLVREGERVRRGQPIARVGQTGRTSGPHLHFEVREGTRPRNPLLYLP